jgi:glycosyltransferase involved in cell wall biosynthesis
MSHGLEGVRIVVMSRCTWTLFNFRKSLMESIVGAGARLVAMGAGGDGYERPLADSGFDVRAIPLSRSGIAPLSDAWLVLHLVHFLRHWRPAIVHTFTIKPAIFGTLAAALARVPVRVVTITGLGHSFTSAGRVVRAIVTHLYRAALRRADLVFFQNAEDHSLFLQLGLVTADRSRVVPGSGVDLRRFSVVPLPSRDGKPVRFLMVARLLREKGVMEFVEAARRVTAGHPQVSFQLLGGPDPRNPTSLGPQELTQLRDSSVVEWIDEVEDVRPYIAAADVLVLPSYREGLPRSLLEGAAMGRAIVTTDTVGCRDVVEDGANGYLVRVMDAADLAQALEKLSIEPDLVARMGAASRARAERLFDERLVIRETLATYERLLRTKVNDAAATPAT